ncbi:MAG: helix-turn-helix domain-containing protein [Maricaulaceae bacterium]
MTLKDAAAVLGISVDTLRRRAKDRLLVTVRFGNQTRILRRDLLDFIDRSRVTCQTNPNSGSVNTSSPSVGTVRCGAQPGTTPRPAKPNGNPSVLGILR